MDWNSISISNQNNDNNNLNHDISSCLIDFPIDFQEKLICFVKNFVESRKNVSVLIIECNDGDIVRKLALLNIVRLIAMDRCRENIEKCHNKSPTTIQKESGSTTTAHKNGELEYLIDDIEHSIVHDSSIDLIVDLSLIGKSETEISSLHIANVQRILKENNSNWIVVGDKSLNLEFNSNDFERQKQFEKNHFGNVFSFTKKENNLEKQRDNRKFLYTTLIDKDQNENSLTFLEKNNRKQNNIDDDDDDDDDELDANFFDDEGDPLAAATASQIWEV